MKTMISYPKSQLLSELDGKVKNVGIQAIDTICGYDDLSKTIFFYFVDVERQVEIVTLKCYFFTTMRVVSKGHPDEFLYSDNITVEGKPVKHLYECDFISPKFDMAGDFVIANEDLDRWLLRYMSREYLDSIAKKTIVYDKIVYAGVSTPKIDGKDANGKKQIDYLYQDLVLDEKQIQEVLDSIKDEMLRESIRCILYARVFKKNGYGF